MTLTSTETTINVEWTVDDATASFEIIYGISGDINNVETIPVTKATQNGATVSEPITGLQPGHLYEVELLQNGATVEKSTVATSEFTS